MPKALQPLQLMIVYKQNMLTSDKLILPLLHKNDHVQDTKHKDANGEGATMDINGWEVVTHG